MSRENLVPQRALLLRMNGAALLLAASTFVPGYRAAGAAFAQPASAPFHVERLAEGVFGIVRHEPEAMANNANSVVVIGTTDVLVVDAQFTRVATLQTIAAIRTLTSLPVRYLVNTHWHDDHAAGNQVYRDTFPGVTIVSQHNTRRDLATLGATNRADNVRGGEAYVSRLERLMAMGLGFDSTALGATEAAALRSTATLIRQYIRESPDFQETLPTLTFGNDLTFHLGDHHVDVRWFGPANTDGDAVVFVRDAGVIATGDLVVFPVPFAFNAHIAAWITALDSVRTLQHSVLVPGHGPVQRDDRYLTLVARLLARVRDETASAAAAGASLADTRKRVTLLDERDALAGEDKWKRIIFDLFFVRPAVGQAYAEATAKR